MTIDKEYGRWRIGRATELQGSDRAIYRSLEMAPGILSWGTIGAVIVASYWLPFFAAVFIIAFDIFWFLKTVFLSIHLRQNWRRVRQAMATDWTSLLASIPHCELYHMVLLPFYNESSAVLLKSIEAVASAHTDLSKIIMVVATEERAGEAAALAAKQAVTRYGSTFGHFLVTVHPAGVPGEMPGKGSNISYASEQARIAILDRFKIRYDSVIVSAFDIDTVVYPEYFSCLAWYVSTHPRPLHASFQPVPLYNNNIWSVPALSRIVAFSGTFWQMVQQERPERLATFSSHAMLFETLYRIGYWQSNMVSEDSRIFWNCFMATGGDYEVVPISYPVSMDANLAESFLGTLRNIYLQQRRWSWGAENIPYIIFNFIKGAKVPLRKKIKASLIQLEGFWSLATNPIMIFLLGWLPVLIGQGRFNRAVLAYNLPWITRDIMFVTMFGLVVSSYLAFLLLPEPAFKVSPLKRFWVFIQWILVPITITVFGAIPALDAQTRLLVGRYLGFWVTPKHRS